MKVSIKTLNGSTFEIDLDASAKVADVKKLIETTQGQNVYPADQQVLIHQGRVLKNETTLEENKILENNFIVIMVSKKGSSGAASAAAKESTSQTSVDRAILASPATQPPQGAPTPVVPVSAPIPTATAGPAPTSAAITEHRLRWFGHVQRRPPEAPVRSGALRRVDNVRRGRGRPKLTWDESVKRDLKEWNISMDLAMDRSAWRLAINVPEPTEADPYGQAASNLVAGGNLEAMIQSILEIGGGAWDRDTVMRALQAAYNNPERAVEYLYSGFPELKAAPAAAGTGPASGHPADPVQAPQSAQPAIPSSGPNANPLDLFPQAVPNASSNAGGGNLDVLRNNTQFRGLLSLVQANPQILQPLLQELGKQNPQIMQLIQENQNEFLSLINERAEGAEGDLLDQFAGAGVPQTIEVTADENAAIERLEHMGFDRDLVLEVFFACNKDEHMAANYLLDHQNEFDDDAQR